MASKRAAGLVLASLVLSPAFGSRVQKQLFAESSGLHERVEQYPDVTGCRAGLFNFQIDSVNCADPKKCTVQATLDEQSMTFEGTMKESGFFGMTEQNPSTGIAAGLDIKFGKKEVATGTQKSKKKKKANTVLFVNRISVTGPKKGFKTFQFVCPSGEDLIG
mmetsp:Transcript_17918/g.31434  ORF Transcript_17918/g.31434 Transcript_17918/m.31434 type:complete len:162 (-) Transcript_17918:115-600(-)|eukprot:CAMPEP_0197628876 /NCGR_PEP_ID=MMETSP1338-20131121/6985_1 /TAXON_ID=43686 ORGANISM="Pelagodinium beii, Strain RCC1491" /NCGR_SAMPLE_ID=MMETSP1338 /ASSEMBLY_ACC=CAM_ASM_000754 /LENGTH=161 /DNA_ID=CAMNT_0043199877 /DNA_START=44 /DNA_END=529 /DNA_ORIENTATION=+